MGKPLLLTEHLRFRMRLRQIPRRLIEDVLDHPLASYDDALTGCQVAVGQVRYTGNARLFAVIFEELPGMLRVVTAHPIRSGQHAMRVKRGRWKPR